MELNDTHGNLRSLLLLSRIPLFNQPLLTDGFKKPLVSNEPSSQVFKSSSDVFFSSAPNKSVKVKKALTPLSVNDPLTLEALALLKQEDVGTFNTLQVKLQKQKQFICIKDQDLSGLDLQGVDFTNTQIENVCFDNANLNLSVFSNAEIKGSTFNNTSLKSAYFKGAFITHATFDNANLKFANLQTETLDHTRFKQAEMQNVTLSSADVENLDFTGANLTGAKLDYLRPQSPISFKQATLKNTVLNHSDFSSANFSEATLTNAQCYCTDFTIADFTGATLDDQTLIQISPWKNVKGLNQTLTIPTLSGEDAVSEYLQKIPLEVIETGSQVFLRKLTEELLLQKLPDLMTNDRDEAVRLIKAIAKNVDMAWYRSSFGINHQPHPIEAELCLLLRHSRSKELLKDLVLGITAPYSLVEQGITASEINSTVIDTWRDVGLLGHDFKRWKFDARAGDDGKTLLEEYGFKSLDDRKTDEVFGKGYLLTKETNPFATMDDATKVEFRRGYLLVTNPKAGTLVVRNSSKIFGRDKLPYSAFYAPVGLNEKEIKGLTPQWNDNFTDLMYFKNLQNNGRPQNIRYLMDELMSVRADYRRWKFDVSAKDASGFSTAHLSPGFIKTLETARNLALKQDSDYFFAQMEDPSAKPPKPLKLAFVDPEYPVYAPLGELIDKAVFELTGDNLIKLTRLTDPAEGEQPRYDEDLVAFLSQGVQYQNAELVIL